jgi:hypothetical protein
LVLKAVKVLRAPKVFRVAQILQGLKVALVHRDLKELKVVSGFKVSREV